MFANVDLMSFHTVFKLFHVFIYNHFENTAIPYHPNHLLQFNIYEAVSYVRMHALLLKLYMKLKTKYVQSASSSSTLYTSLCHKHIYAYF
jgi:hypothetical protein